MKKSTKYKRAAVSLGFAAALFMLLAIWSPNSEVGGKLVGTSFLVGLLGAAFWIAWLAAIEHGE